MRKSSGLHFKALLKEIFFPIFGKVNLYKNCTHKIHSCIQTYKHKINIHVHKKYSEREKLNKLISCICNLMNYLKTSPKYIFQ